MPAIHLLQSELLWCSPRHASPATSGASLPGSTLNGAVYSRRVFERMEYPGNVNTTMHRAFVAKTHVSRRAPLVMRSRPLRALSTLNWCFHPSNGSRRPLTSRPDVPATGGPRRSKCPVLRVQSSPSRFASPPPAFPGSTHSNKARISLAWRNDETDRAATTEMKG